MELWVHLMFFLRGGTIQPLDSLNTGKKGRGRGLQKTLFLLFFEEKERKALGIFFFYPYPISILQSWIHILGSLLVTTTRRSRDLGEERWVYRRGFIPVK